MNTFTICILASIIFISCSFEKSKTSILLEKIDSLTLNENYTKADSLLKGIRYSELTNDKDKAIYGLLRDQTCLATERPISSDSLISLSIEYFKKTDDNNHLARAYYYRGIYFYYIGEIQNALIFLKKAENIDKKINIPNLRYLIYANMSYINRIAGAKSTGLSYANKALDIAMQNENISWICFAYNCIATTYYDMGKKDSAFIFINKIRPYIYKINNKEERAGYLNNIGLLYYENGLYNEAENYFKKSEALFDISNTKINLTKTYYMLGKDREADSLFKVVWPKASYEDKAEILQFLAERAEKQGEFKASSRFYKQAKAMQDSVNANKKTEEAVAAQRDFEHEKYKEDVARNEVWSAAVVVVAVAALAFWAAVYHRRKMNRAKEMIERGNKLTAEYTARITELELADSRHSHEAQELRRKIKKLKDEQNAILSRGQQLYNGIMAGGTTATWKKQDFDEFIEFYRVAHPQAVADAENGYRRLSSTNIFYLILRDMQVADDDAQRILCMTAGAMRTMKSRINARKTD